MEQMNRIRYATVVKSYFVKLNYCYDLKCLHCNTVKQRNRENDFGSYGVAISPNCLISEQVNTKPDKCSTKMKMLRESCHLYLSKFQKHQSVKRRKDLEITQETVTCEMSIRHKKYFS